MKPHKPRNFFENLKESKIIRYNILDEEEFWECPTCYEDGYHEAPESCPNCGYKVEEYVYEDLFDTLGNLCKKYGSDAEIFLDIRNMSAHFCIEMKRTPEDLKELKKACDRDYEKRLKKYHDDLASYEAKQKEIEAEERKELQRLKRKYE